VACPGFEEEKVSSAITIATPRFLDALSYAMELHGSDVRKGAPSIPYAAHLLSVCSLVLLDGGTEDEAIAGLLHDALEDHPEATSRQIIAQRFGDRVRVLVEACSDTPPDYRGGPKPPWKGRKAAYLSRLEVAGPEERRVSMADKLDNARSIVSDYHTHGELLWSHFNAGKEDQLWFYRSLKRIFGAENRRGFLVEEFGRTVTEMERLLDGSVE
jgi:(p)ppGpp synthase/HD superfamily hydrolase